MGDVTDYKEFVGKVAFPKSIQKAEADMEDYNIVHILGKIEKKQELASNGIRIISLEERIDVLITSLWISWPCSEYCRVFLFGMFFLFSCTLLTNFCLLKNREDAKQIKEHILEFIPNWSRKRSTGKHTGVMTDCLLYQLEKRNGHKDHLKKRK